jgi:hypothetical protein
LCLQITGEVDLTLKVEAKPDFRKTLWRKQSDETMRDKFNDFNLDRKDKAFGTTLFSDLSWLRRLAPEARTPKRQAGE